MDEIDELVAAAARHDERAWHALWASIEPPLSRLLAEPHFLGPAACDEDREHIVSAVHARLRADRFARLHLYLEAKRANPRLRFTSWLQVVAKRAGIDYLRTRAEVS